MVTINLQPVNQLYPFINFIFFLKQLMCKGNIMKNNRVLVRLIRKKSNARVPEIILSQASFCNIS
ncbi:hypothetical protein V520_11500 [Pseudomonas putida KG-4]|nr:hypothetical protein V520_11500 [Pseudomonas putida KG-4]